MSETMKTQDLVEILAKLKPGIARQKAEIVEQSASYVFFGDRVISYNDEIFVSLPLTTGFEGAVKAQELYDLIARISKPEITLSVEKDSGHLSIASGQMKAGIAMESEIKIPIDSIKPPKKEGWKPLPKEFKKGVKICLPSASRNMSQILLTGLHIKGKKIESTDGYRISQFTMDKNMTEILLPGEPAQHLLDYEISQYAVKDSWIYFQTEEKGLLLACRLYSHTDYPNLAKITEKKGRSIKFPTNIKEILGRTSVFLKDSSGDTSLVEVSLEKNKITFTGEGPFGRITEWAKVKYSEEPFSFLTYVSLLIDISSRLKEAVVTDRSVNFYGDDFIHVVALRTSTGE